ncbi:unnamed protein product [Bursaphelenchus xylophilus]|nr:unnamed protein product [Bursaphelenchus xylophilus]CAG9129295.1 unnamed protein product [Bursaphelenchus xylophilus]
MMAQKRMADFYDTFRDCVPEIKRMKLAVEMLKLCEEDVELFKELPSLLQQRFLKRRGKRMNPVVLAALVANFPKMERFCRYKSGNDLIYDKKIAAFGAYKILSVLSRRIRIALFVHLRLCDIFMNEYDHKSICCRKGDTVLFNAPSVEFIHFYMHFPFQAKNVQLNCQCKPRNRVSIPNEARCLANILNDEKRGAIPACELLSLLENVESVKASPKCLMQVHRRLELSRIRFVDRALTALKFEGDVLKIVNNTGENFKFHVLLQNIKPSVEPKTINFKVGSSNSRYPTGGLIKPLRSLLSRLQEVNLVYCVTGKKAESAFVALCKEGRTLAKTLRVNFRLRSVQNGDVGRPEIKDKIVDVMRKFNSNLAAIDHETNCGYGFDWADGNLSLHVCSGYNPRCALERNDGKRDAPADRARIYNIVAEDRDDM